MYVDKDARGYFQLMEMTLDEFKSLVNIIKGAALPDKRKFDGMLHEIGFKEKK